MKTFLVQGKETNYLRKLVRALNSQENGFYARWHPYNIRCNRARIKNGIFQIKKIGAEWIIVSDNYFEDCYGREIAV